MVASAWGRFASPRCSNTAQLFGNLLKRARGKDETHHSRVLGLDERPVGPVHLVVEAAGIAEVVPIAVAPPEGSRGRRAVDALAALCKMERDIIIGLLGIEECGGRASVLRPLTQL